MKYNTDPRNNNGLVKTRIINLEGHNSINSPLVRLFFYIILTHKDITINIFLVGVQLFYYPDPLIFLYICYQPGLTKEKLYMVIKLRFLN